jgi:hypothetical protein
MFRRKTGLVIDPYFPAPRSSGCWTRRRSARARRARRNRFRHHGLLAGLAVDRRQGACHRLFQRFAYAAVQHSGITLGRRNSRTARHPQGGSARGQAFCRAFSDRPIRRCSSAPTVSRSRESPATSRRRCSGSACHGPGLAKNTYGTGSFVLMNTGKKLVFSKEKLLTHHRLGDWRRAGRVCSGRRHLHHRRGRAVAARWL